MVENPMTIDSLWSTPHRAGDPITCWDGADPVEFDDPSAATCAGERCRVHFEDGDEVHHCPICDQYFCGDCWHDDKDICEDCHNEGLGVCDMCGKSYVVALGDDLWCKACKEGGEE